MRVRLFNLDFSFSDKSYQYKNGTIMYITWVHNERGQIIIHLTYICKYL